MRILAIDTTSEFGGVAVYESNKCLSIALNTEPASRYAVSLFELAERALAEADTGFADIDLYAVSNGPGSFTGIRVGLAAAQGWAKAFEKPVKGVNLLEAMVEQACPAADWAVPVLDARRGEFFVGVFHKAAGGPDGGATFETAGPAQLVRPDRFSTLIETISQGGQCRAFSGGTVACLIRSHDQKARTLLEDLPPDVLRVEVEGELLKAIVRLGLREFTRGDLPSSDRLDACYIRRSDAEMNWRPTATNVKSP
jgi:tRNA threonylcarbamoyl adenosine modification protein YeaZ